MKNGASYDDFKVNPSYVNTYKWTTEVGNEWAPMNSVTYGKGTVSSFAIEDDIAVELWDSSRD